MELSIVDNLRTLRLDLVLTLAAASVFLFAGYFLQRRIGFLRRASIPAAVLGGLTFAAIALALRASNMLGIALDTSLRAPLQTLFFTTIGLSATLTLLRAGGWRAPLLWLLATIAAVVQNVVGIALAFALGAPLALGIICGALTLTGGPATGLAFADRFEEAGIAGASTIIIAAATFGIFTSSLVGNPVATALIRRFRLASPHDVNGGKEEATRHVGESETNTIARISDDTIESSDETKRGDAGEHGETNSNDVNEKLTTETLLGNLAITLIVMGAGALAGFVITPYFTLPGYIGAMVVAAVLRNLDDRFGFLRINARAVEAIGTTALAFFLVIALMDLKLWQLAGLAVPMLVILGVQIVVMILYSVAVTFVVMGRDYEAAVTTSGHIGFGLGITPNAVANMEALAARYEAAPRSFLVVPIVGAFFIDFSNALVINLFINWLR